MVTPKKVCRAVLSGLFLLLLVGPAAAQFKMQFQPGQFPGGGGGGKGGFGGWSDDPAERFKKMANGKDHIVIADQNPMFKGAMEEYAKKNNISDGKMSLDQYMKYSEERKKMWSQGGGFKFTMPGSPPGAPPTGAPGGGKPGDSKPGD